MSAAPGRAGEALVASAAELSAEELQRYSRHILLPGVGELGQRRLKNARVLVIGAGGLGSPVLLYLAAAGVGTLGIIEDDHVELSNLQRQVIHGVSDVGASKLQSAAATIAEINPLTSIRLHHTRLSARNALELCADYDVIVDGTDNFATRYLASDTAALLGIPHVWGAVSQFEGQLSVFWQKHGPSYRDLYPDAPPAGAAPSCGEGGVFGMLCGVIGSMMAAEVVKLITGVGDAALGRVLFFNSLTASWRELAIAPDPGAEPIAALTDYEAFCGVAPAAGVALGEGAAGDVTAAVPTAAVPTAAAAAVAFAAPDAAASVSAQERTLSVQRLAALLAQRACGEADFDLIDVREAGEHALVHIPGSRLVPLAQILAGAGAGSGVLARDRDIVLYCKASVRSASALAALQSEGFTRARYLSGGVLAWVAEIDPTLPNY